MTTAETMLRPITPPGSLEHGGSLDHGAELKRGAWANLIAMFASNFRGIFTFLVARLLGPAALGIFSVAWATTDLVSKIGIFGLGDAIITFIARAEAAGDRARSRTLFHLAVLLGVLQCAALTAIAIAMIQFFGNRLGLDPEMVAALSVMLCAMPVIALYRVSTSVSRGMKVMRHDIFSRGITETIATTLAFLGALQFGKTFAPEIAVIVGMGASGIVALFLAASLFRSTPSPSANLSYLAESRRLQLSRWTMAALLVFTVHAGAALTLLRWPDEETSDSPGSIALELAPVIARHQAVLSGSFILGIYGPAFRQGGMWFGIVALACATNAFVSLAETVIMVQKPRLNLLNSIITCVVALAANLWLISRFGVTGAAFGILLPYVLQGILRYRALRLVFRWRNPWGDVGHPLLAALIAAVPAFACRALIDGLTGQVVAAIVFLLIYGGAWLYYRYAIADARLKG